MKIFKCIVDGELENMRVDRYIKKLCRNESVSRIFKAFKNILSIYLSSIRIKLLININI